MDSMPAPVRLEPPDDSDWPQILAIESVSFARPWTEASFRRERQLAYSRILVARLGAEGGVAGYACRWLVAGEVQLLNVAVHPRHRRHGIARTLVEAVLEEARRERAPVWLEVERGNVGAVALYCGLGFSIVGQRRNYYGRGRDAWVMAVPAPDGDVST